MLRPRPCRNEIKEITQKIVVAKEEARIAAELADKKAARAQVGLTRPFLCTFLQHVCGLARSESLGL